jgi:hypothetical protein
VQRTTAWSRTRAEPGARRWQPRWLFAVIELALLLVFLGTSQSSAGLLHAGGWAVFAFVVIGAYLFVDAMNSATGGKPLPLGRPVLG